MVMHYITVDKHYNTFTNTATKSANEAMPTVH